LRRWWCARPNTARTQAAAVAFLESVRAPLDEIVTHRFDIEQAPDAFKLFDSGNTGKVVFDWT
jgi:threonine dehydrogenase-like Zn-dependent dehydrogenase